MCPLCAPTTQKTTHTLTPRCKLGSGRDGEYWQVPMGLFYGLFVPIPFYLIHKYWPKLRADYINTFIICNWLGWLSVGINTSLLPYFLFGFLAQWLKRYKAIWYMKWHLTTVAAIAGGMSYPSSCLVVTDEILTPPPPS